MEILKSEPIALPSPDSKDTVAVTDDLKEPKQVSLLCLQQYLTRNNHLPPNLNAADVFVELNDRLNDKDWEIRHHALKTLFDLIPTVRAELGNKLARDILGVVTVNLGNPVPAIRKSALDVIIAFVKFNSDPESVLRDVITHGLESSNPSATLTLNIIQCIPVILKTVQSYSSTNITHHTFSQMVVSLAKKMVQITHQEQVLECLLKIKNLVGDSVFNHFLETYYPQVKRDFDILCDVYNVVFDKSDQSDLSDMELPDAELDLDENENQLLEGPEQDDETSSEHVTPEIGERSDELIPSDCANSDDDVVMKVYDEDGNELKRSSRRVTFGGEIVKIRTPDSDAVKEVDITANIVIRIAADDDVSETVSVTSHVAKRASHIPVPVRPALNPPREPKFRYPIAASLERSLHADYDVLAEIPNYEGDSLTSSSDSEQSKRTSGIGSGSSEDQKRQVLVNNVITDLAKMKINDKIVAENVFKMEDRLYIRGLDRLISILRQPDVVQSLTHQEESTIGVSLLCYILNRMIETRTNQHLVSSSLQVLKTLCQSLETDILSLYLEAIVPTFCSFLGCAYNNTVRLDAVEILKMLMRKFSPNVIVETLFTERCFFSKSSKTRENALQCLMYALLTFPSTEFNTKKLIDTLITHGIAEPKKRVRQALLDTMSILGQFVPRSQFKVDVVGPESLSFKRALRARLTRRQLPVVSPEGLILYAFRVSSGTAFGTDVEWILSGRGSVSDNFNKSEAQFNFAHGDDISPVQNKYNWSKTMSDKSVFKYFHQHTMSTKGFSDEGLYSEQKFNMENRLERYSADWTDPRYVVPSTYGSLNHRCSSNLSDTSSYGSSYMSDQSFPKLNPAYDSSLFSVGRPASDDKLNRLPWYSKYKHTSKLPVRLEPTVSQVPIYYGYNSSASLPILYDKKNDIILHNTYKNQKEEMKTQSKEQKWIKNYENEALRGNADEDEAKKPQEESKKTASLNSGSSLKAKGHNPFGDQSGTHESKSQNSSAPGYVKKMLSANGNLNQKPKFLERKAGIRLKRSLTKEIKIPQSSFNIDPETLPPFEHAKDGLCKTLLQFESREWETTIQALKGVVRLAKHHSKQFSPCIHSYVVSVSKEIRNLRSQVARAACLSAESIFKYISKLSDQDIEELANALFSRSADTNKFLREDSIKALDALVEHVRFSKCILHLVHKASSHPHQLVRATAARLLSKLVQSNGPTKILSLPKESKELILNMAVKLLMDGNLETRTHAKAIFVMLAKDPKFTTILSESVPGNLLASINKSLSRIIRK